MNPNQNRPRLVIVVNSAIALGFLQGQLEYFQNRGFQVTVLCPGRRNREWEVARPDGIPIIEVPMEREIAPWRDLQSLWHLWNVMRKLRPTITNVGTPKAGLLGGLAAWLNRVPCRYYTLHGLRFETTKGLKRAILVYAERLACRFAHRVFCVSHSVREKAITWSVTSRERAVVFGSGSCNGVDTSRFAATPAMIRHAAGLRRRLGIPQETPVVMFVGRLTSDKGIPELMDAFLRLDKRLADLRLVLAGCFEDEDTLPAHTRRCIETHPRVIFAGAVHDTAPYYAMADVVVLPSHREGLPTVVLEAQAAGKPVIGASATGIVDLIKDGETGLLFPVGDAAALAKSLARLISDKALAARIGFAGLQRVRREFRQEQVWEALYQGYLADLQTKKRPPFFMPLPTQERQLSGPANQ